MRSSRSSGYLLSSSDGSSLSISGLPQPESSGTSFFAFLEEEMAEDKEPEEEEEEELCSPAPPPRLEAVAREPSAAESDQSVLGTFHIINLLLLLLLLLLECSY